MTGKMENVKKTIKGNKKLKLHTLLLLDIDREVNINMSVSDALKLLLKARQVKKLDNVIVLSRAGGESEIYYKSVKDLLTMDIGLPAVIVIPGKLHFREKDFLELFQ